MLDRVSGGPGLRRGAGTRAISRWATPWTGGGWKRSRLGLLRLRAEMRLPGLAWLEFIIEEVDGATVLRQRAVFHPHGLAGHLLGRGRPFHGIVFGGMQRNIARAAEAAACTRAGV